MINALYIVKFAEDASADQKSEIRDAARELCGRLAPTFACEIVPEDSPSNAGELFCELGFAERADYDDAAASETWEALRSLLEEAVMGDMTFVAYGPGEERLQGDESACHRVMLVHLVDGVAPEQVENMRRRLLEVGEYVPGLVNMQISEVFDSAGAVPWNYVYDCDFDTAATFLGKYMTSPYHWGYLRLVQSDCVECVADMQMTPYIPVEKAFLTSLA
ncbi:hypothetical protein [uncultured Adlercreutzia sp.]|uniref:hypothetical protein n=1 Tax=uncultured Adlercreutzia sp. TaxID=875803 RepID=UPI002674847C|nr:hypothetical protein [uncultured Adlercreutzia sp.]